MSLFCLMLPLLLPLMAFAAAMLAYAIDAIAAA